MKTPINGYDIPKQKVPVYRRVMGGHSPKAAIRMFCAMCVGWERGAVEECTAPDCPLFPYRRSARKVVRKQVADERSPAAAGSGMAGPPIVPNHGTKAALKRAAAARPAAEDPLSERSADHESQNAD